RPGEVLLAIGELLATVVGEAHRRDGAAIDRRQPAADHRQHAGSPGAARTEIRDEGIAALRRNIDEKIVGQVRRQAAAPVTVEVTTNDAEEQQRHDAGAEGDDLHDAVGSAPAETGDAIPPGDSGAGAQPAGCHDEERAGQGEYGDESSEPEREAEAELPVEHDP